ncbi:carbohydrate kinase family protein [Winogradskyella alexanderae]|uniref:Carbohydrate kinase n=1 Tax=Winogradskyella alexanderae TaxID=2877123 RepID=A0ABS7XSW9_9FLAO|nr:carbohydrate kinase [Winogradskyella alexanderae]MCA0132518.1 carbohydrate kinase [Winogradskyella alexanderae]
MCTVTCFGEVLWDVFPDHKSIGGAPLNVAIRLASFGNKVNMISSVGTDNDGKKLVGFIEENGVNTNGIQVCSNFKTSNVVVSLDDNGSATYKIEKPCAWDDIHITDILRSITSNSDVFIYGSLCVRSEKSKSTLMHLLNYAGFKVFDVNLRRPHYENEDLFDLMLVADLIKFNDDEIAEICGNLNFESESIEDMIKFISHRTRTNLICVTLGRNGAVFYKKGKFYRNDGYNVKVKDTVGAGDSFLATLIDGLMGQIDIQIALDRACAIGAIVASKNGATPTISKNDIDRLINT